MVLKRSRKKSKIRRHSKKLSRSERDKARTSDGMRHTYLYAAMIPRGGTQSRQSGTDGAFQFFIPRRKAGLFTKPSNLHFIFLKILIIIIK
jgi:hypothetical protein